MAGSTNEAFTAICNNMFTENSIRFMFRFRNVFIFPNSICVTNITCHNVCVWGGVCVRMYIYIWVSGQYPLGQYPPDNIPPGNIPPEPPPPPPVQNPPVPISPWTISPRTVSPPDDISSKTCVSKKVFFKFHCFKLS